MARSNQAKSRFIGCTHGHGRARALVLHERRIGHQHLCLFRRLRFLSRTHRSARNALRSAPGTKASLLSIPAAPGDVTVDVTAPPGEALQSMRQECEDRYRFVLSHGSEPNCGGSRCALTSLVTSARMVPSAFQFHVMKVPRRKSPNQPISQGHQCLRGILFYSFRVLRSDSRVVGYTQCRVSFVPAASPL